MSNFIEEHKFVNVGNSSFIAANEDIFNTDPRLDVVNMKDWREITWVIQKGAGANGTATITVNSCDDVVPTTEVDLAYRYRINTSGDTWGAWTEVAATGFTTTACANQMYEVSVRADELDGTNQYVTMTATEGVDSPCDGGITAILTGGRYNEDVNATVIV